MTKKERLMLIESSKAQVLSSLAAFEAAWESCLALEKGVTRAQVREQVEILLAARQAYGLARIEYDRALSEHVTFPFGGGVVATASKKATRFRALACARPDRALAWILG